MSVVATLDRLLGSFGRFRACLTLLFLVIGFGLIPIGKWLGDQSAIGSLLVNLAPEAIGVVFTIAILDWLNEMRQNRAEARRMAYVILHEVDHAVWVWQGGRRDLDVSELLGLLDTVTDEDPIPWFLENLLMQIGSQAANMTRLRQGFLAGSPSLRLAVQRLVPLVGIRDGSPNRARDVAGILREAAVHLHQVVSTETPPSSLDAEWQKDASENAQHWRHFGREP